MSKLDDIYEGVLLQVIDKQEFVNEIKELMLELIGPEDLDFDYGAELTAYLSELCQKVQEL
jgi:hypothetical protein